MKKRQPYRLVVLALIILALYTYTILFHRRCCWPLDHQDIHMATLAALNASHYLNCVPLNENVPTF
jgi:hypothetical protein